MKLEHSFLVPVDVEQAWAVLTDIAAIAPCMPGAAVTSIDGDDFTGTVEVKLGPIRMKYQGNATFVAKDSEAHRAIIDARGRDAKGNGTAAAQVTAQCVEHGDSTRVDVITDLNITGRPAQFGRAVMEDVGNKLIGQFSQCLASTLASGTLSPDGDDNPEQPPVRLVASQESANTFTPINLVNSVGPALFKRLAVPTAVITGLILIALAVRRRRS